MTQTKKNKMNRTVTWPTTTYFTFDDLHKLNPSFDKKITLRVRLANAVSNGTVVEIGSIPGGCRRPPKVYVLSPVTQFALDKAESDGIVVPGEARQLVTVAKVTATNSKTFPSHVPSTVK